MIGTLRSDLWTAAADPLPRMRGPRPLARLPHVLVVLYAVVMVDAAGGHGDPTYSPLAIGQAAAVVLALFRPVPAWWVSLLVMAVGSQTGLPMREHPIYLSPGTPFSWSSSAAALQAMLFLLVALRVRPRVLAEMVTITVLVALAFLVGEPWGHHTGAAAVWLVIVLAAAVIGAALRGARVARTQLVVQEEVTPGAPPRPPCSGTPAGSIPPTASLSCGTFTPPPVSSNLPTPAFCSASPLTSRRTSPKATRTSSPSS